ncbi:TlpA family protein disulfide reductase [Psychroserpens ponticola]|uniref:TlpA disulfide reductase family protein n=1 Tax=Psychroserpens ponticola TaxID=2932268 RepID=A0ABY7RTG5_9FLAO|nr:TlpA disulfide reductase family protein [Psychroserpens ponticola]WCO00386.1 TlpA disulfide reductase family protein [Psychroserpens ponticola]
MKRILLVLCAISLFACKEEPKDYVTLSGTITNSHESKTLKVFKDKAFEKIIVINEDGTFSDTLKVTDGDYSIKHGDEFGSIYLKNGFESSIEVNYEDFDNTIVYNGDGSDINNYVIQSYLLSNTYFTEDLFSDPNTERLNKAVTDYKAGFKNLETNYSGLDSLHKANGAKNMEGTIKSIKKYLSGKIALRESLPEGMTSPTFENYINFKGGTTSLSDLKGKYVYVDIWATWCGPCKREIPSLKKVEEQFHGKNIEFVSISVDDERRSGTKEKAFESWKTMVKDKELGGIQLFSDNAWQSDFVKNYKVNGIPRFILIDPNGNIVSPDAPRPSNPKLVELLEEKLSV